MKSEQHNGLRIGITGGIGSGKSTVCRIFESLGIPVYDADYWAKWLLNHEEHLKKAVKEIFGTAAYTPTGEYDRAYVAKIAFQDPEKLAALNAIAHPAVAQHSQAWHAEKIAENAPYTIKEAALMIESGGHRAINFLIVVTAPEQLRIERIMQRDHSTEAEVLARIKNQWPEAQKIALADSVIVNDGQHSLVQQVWNIHQKLLKMG